MTDHPMSTNNHKLQTRQNRTLSGKQVLPAGWLDSLRLHLILRSVTMGANEGEKPS